MLKFDKFDSLSLHLPDTSHTRHTLAQLLDRFTHPEAVSGVACDGCNREKDPSQPTVTSTALKTLSIGKVCKLTDLILNDDILYSLSIPLSATGLLSAVSVQPTSTLSRKCRKIPSLA